MPTIYFLCGMAASGKTTIAKEIERERGAIRFTLDERMIAKYQYSIFDDEYGYLANEEKQQIWEDAKAVLREGKDVVLDWSLWSRAARKEWIGKAISEGYEHKLIYLDVPIDLLKQRLAERNAIVSDSVHFIPLDELERFKMIFEPPSEDEGLNLEVVSVDG